MGFAQVIVSLTRLGHRKPSATMQTEQTQVTPRPRCCKSSILARGFSRSLPCYFPSLGRQPSTGPRLVYLSLRLSLKIAFKSQDHGPILQKGKQSFLHNTEIFGYFLTGTTFVDRISIIIANSTTYPVFPCRIFSL